MHLSSPSYALPACFLALLAACGGGGGGGGGPADVQFTAFSAIAPNQRANMNGISQTASGTGTTDSGGNFTVSSAAAGPLDTINSGARITFDSNRNISAMSFNAPQSSAAFSSGVNCSAGAVCAAETATSAGVLGNPSFPAHNWNYQTFGVWFNLPSPTTFQAGALSAGAITPASAVPTTGSALFTGFTSGFYINATGEPHFSSANVTANVNFAAIPSQTIAFSTSNMTIGNLNTGATSTDAVGGLNLSGTLTYNAGTNQFTGNLTATTNLLNGTATGSFYGPAAQELGGVYNLTGTGLSRMIGAFGARRP